MIRRRLLALSCLCAVLGAASPAWALCDRTDLAGTWLVYVIGHSRFGPFVERCTISVDTAGDSRASCATTDLNVQLSGRVTGSADLSTGAVSGRAQIRSKATLGGGPYTATGTLAVNSRCVVTGRLVDDEGTTKITHAALDRGKTTMSGIGTFAETGRNPKSILQFNAIKR